MRELKFRAWEKSSKTMVYDVQEAGRKWIIGESACESFQEVLDSWEYEVMQFTGLYDRNGREIYEGDILELANGEGALRSVVEYHAPSFCYRWLNLKEAKLRGINVEPLLWNTHIIFKVIGNIYEHPHLFDWKDAKE